MSSEWRSDKLDCRFLTSKRLNNTYADSGTSSWDLMTDHIKLIEHTRLTISLLKYTRGFVELSSANINLNDLNIKRNE